MEDGEENEFSTCKVVILGEPGVGKTSIISRYVTNQFSPVVISTTGASYSTKILKIDDENSIKFQIWDTAGQERFRSLAKIFYQNAVAVILVYDITVRETFEQLQKYWIKEIEENAPTDIILALAANKSDMYENELVGLNEGKELARQLNAIFKSTSALNSKGIDDLFLSIGKKFLDPTYSVNISNCTEKSETRNNSKTLKIPKKAKEKKKCCQNH
jgi:Ras-related protein Rab-5C